MPALIHHQNYRFAALAAWFLPAEYGWYASLVVLCRLASGTFLVAGDSADALRLLNRKYQAVDLGRADLIAGLNEPAGHLIART